MGSAILENLARSDAVFGFRVQNGELTNRTGRKICLDRNGRAGLREAPLRRLVEAVSRAALALVSFFVAIFCRSSGKVEMDLSGIQRAAEKGFDEWSAVEIPRLEALGRPLNEGEARDLRAKKAAYETVCASARRIWERQETKPRAPGWMQYEMAGIRERLERLG